MHHEAMKSMKPNPQTASAYRDTAVVLTRAGGSRANSQCADVNTDQQAQTSRHRPAGTDQQAHVGVCGAPSM